MDIKLWLELIAFACMVLGAFWKLNKSIQTQFDTLTKNQLENYHHVDLRLQNIETTVSPYAQNIAALQRQQTDNSLKIAELRAMKDDIQRLERQLEAMQRK